LVAVLNNSQAALALLPTII
jgi:hypothetical protein